MNNYFDRRAIKGRAKAALKKCYWLAFGVAALIGLILGELSLNFNLNLNLSGGDLTQSNAPYDSYGATPGTDMMPVIVIFAIGLTIFVLAIIVAVLFVKAYFLDGAVTMGRARFFLAVTRENAKFSDALSGFTKNYRNVCKVLFSRYLKLFLWELFVLIPTVLICIGATLMAVGAYLVGVAVLVIGLIMLVPSLIPVTIKGYEYAMIPYLMAEHPDMTAKEAFDASRELTMGHKGDLFVLDLSFLGWTILGILCLGVGVFFLEPYIQASRAEAYAELCRLKFQPAPAPFEPIAPPVPQTYVVQEAPTEEPAPVEEPATEAVPEQNVDDESATQTEE